MYTGTSRSNSHITSGFRFVARRAELEKYRAKFGAPGHEIHDCSTDSAGVHQLERDWKERVDHAQAMKNELREAEGRLEVAKR